MPRSIDTDKDNEGLESPFSKSKKYSLVPFAKEDSKKSLILKQKSESEDDDNYDEDFEPFETTTKNFLSGE